MRVEILAPAAVCCALLTTCGSLREEIKQDDTERFAYVAQTIGPSQPRPKWETVMHAQEADLLEFLGPDRVLVSEQELLQAGLLFSMEEAKPAFGAISLYDTKSGQRIWTYQRKRPNDKQLGLLRYALLQTSPSIVLMGVDAEQVVLTGLDPASGSQRWEQKLGGRSSVALSPDGGSIVVASVGALSSKLYSIEAASGAVKWQRDADDLKAEGGRPPLMFTLEGSVVVAGKGLRLLAPDTGADIWEVASPLGKSAILSAGEVPQGLLVLTREQALMLDRGTGGVLWRRAAEGGEIRSGVWQRDMVLLHTRSAGKKDSVVAAGAADGRVLWTHEAGGEVRSSLLCLDDRLYYTGDDGIVSLDLGSSRPAFRAVVPGAFDIGRTLGKYSESLPDLLVTHDDKIVVARETYGVVAVSPTTGQILFAQPVPLSWTHDNTFFARKHDLADKVKYYADLRHEKGVDKKLSIVDSTADDMATSFGASLRRISAAGAASSARAAADARQDARSTTAEISRGMASGEMSTRELQTLQEGRRMSTDAAVEASRGRAASLGAEAAATQVSASMDRMTASIAFWNSVTNAVFSFVEGVQAELQRSALSKAQWELLHAMEVHRRSLQQGFYVRPIRRQVQGKLGFDYAVGVTLVDLDTGRRGDLFFGALSSVAEDDGLELPSSTVSSDRGLLVTDAIGLEPSRFEPYTLGSYVLPYPAVMAFDLSALPLGTAPPANPDILWAANQGQTEVLGKLLAVETDGVSLKTYGVAALITAIKWSHRETARFLAEQGVDLNGELQLETPLMAAANKGDVEIARYLVARGADVNAPRANAFLNPLAIAARDGNLELVRLLVEAGADVNRPEGVYSPLVRAKSGKQACKAPCSKPYDQIIDLLIRSGAKGN